MGTRDPRIDAYIAASAEFAQPILTHLREIIHSACPDVEETMKWSMPFFVYEGNLCHMAAFKKHCAFGYWKGSLIVRDEADRTAMGQFGRITSTSDLPAKRTLIEYTRRAMELNESGVKAPRTATRAAAKKAAAVPADLAAALRKNAKARRTFDAFSPSNKREYVDWITEARRDETRQRRLATTIEWLAEGKPRNWKYM